MGLDRLHKELEKQNDIINDINTLLQELVALNEAALVEFERIMNEDRTN